MSRYEKFASGPASQGQSPITMFQRAHSLHAEDGAGYLAKLLKSTGTEAASGQGEQAGELEPGIDFDAAVRFKIHNIHHARCINVKKWATIGLGFVGENVAEILDPLSRVSWQTQFSKVVDDLLNCGNGYLEVVRDSGGTIRGLFHVPAGSVRIVLEDNFGVDRHFKVRGRGLIGVGRSEVLMAEFGDAASFRRRRGIPRSERISEIIHIPEPDSIDPWYGVPTWLAAAASIELVQAIHQHQFDFHMNRGVPELLVFLTGGRVDSETWDALKNTFNNFVGLGNQFKSGAFNITDPSIEVDVEKIGTENAANGTFFRDMMEALSVAIVSAHGVPPSLAGILIPGKMGAANEASNAVMTFQALTIGPMQHHLETILGCTLGSERGIEGLNRQSFQFKTVVSELSEAMKELQPMDTMGRMRDELGDAAAEGRDLEDGLQKSELEPMESVEDFLRVVERNMRRRPTAA